MRDKTVLDDHHWLFPSLLYSYQACKPFHSLSDNLIESCFAHGVYPVRHVDVFIADEVFGKVLNVLL